MIAKLCLNLKCVRHAMWRVAAVAGIAMLAGCASEVLVVGPQTDRATVALPSGAPRISGAERITASEHQRMLAAFGGEYRAPQIQQVLNGIVERLRMASDVPGTAFRVTILNSASANAFALPSGHLYVTRGLLALTNDTSEVASVLAHEMAHVTSRHAIERQELESRSVLVSRVRAEILNNPGAAQLVRDQAQVAIASFSRQQELDADQTGMRTLAKAGFDPYGAYRFLNSLARNSALLDRLAAEQRGSKPDFNATHPSNPERIQQALLTARQFGEPGLVSGDRGRLFNALNGMIYGEDAAEGFIRGRTFLHSRLGIAFSAPEGFILENTTNAVLGMTPGATEALRFDSAKIAPETELTSFLTDNKIEGLQMAEVRALDVNGLPAATGLARGADWTFRIFAVRIGQQVYRLIYAARAFDAATDQRFLDSFRTFRRLTPQDAARARPLRLAVVVARSVDTADTLSARAGGLDRATERFYLLNGIEPGAAIQSGQSYKTIAD